MRRGLAIAVLTGSFLGLAALPAAAGSERMQLHCQDGRVIERANGSSWWGVDHSAGYVTEHLLITEDGETRYEKEYGQPRGDRSTCIADHFGWVWTVELVRTR